MSPRAACRLETLGFEHVYDYAPGKVDWLAHGLPREGRLAGRRSAGEIADPDAPTCGLADTAEEIEALLAGSRHGFCLVVSERRTVLGRVRAGVLRTAPPDATAESLMEPGPSTVRPSTPADELLRRLADAGLSTAVVTDPEGRLIGVVERGDRPRADGGSP